MSIEDRLQEIELDMALMIVSVVSSMFFIVISI